MTVVNDGTLLLLSCRSNVGPLRFPSTSTRCTTLCWRTEPAPTLNISASAWPQTAVFHHLRPPANCQNQKIQTGMRYLTILGQFPSLSVFTCGVGVWFFSILADRGIFQFFYSPSCQGFSYVLLFASVHPHHSVLMLEICVWSYHDFKRQGGFTFLLGFDWILL